MIDELPPRLDPRAIEPPLYARWMEKGYFHVPADEVLEKGKDPYVIVIPPPNVTAVLHMGHGLNNTIQDVLIRWRRMQGKASLWIPGTDHAGIATQNVVERQLAAQGQTRDDLGREAFVEKVWGFVGETGGTILEQLKAIGASCDWDRTRFTLEPDLSRAVREVFVRLHEKGLIYRGEYIINWCPRCLTALSNEEAEGEETEGRLHHLRYLFDPSVPDDLLDAALEAQDRAEVEARAAREAASDAPGAADPRGASMAGPDGDDGSGQGDGQGDGRREVQAEGRPEPEGLGQGAVDGHGDGHGDGDGDGHGDGHGNGEAAAPLRSIGRLPDGRWYLTVSTTRPETMLGDVAVAVHPEDERYRALVGAKVMLPLTRRTIPIVADDYVDPSFGSGMVKMTPAHDVNDFEMARRAGLEPLTILTPDAHVNENAPEAFRGLGRTQARKAVLNALAAEGLLAGEDAHTHTVPHCYRCDTVVEPRLSEQWFVKMKPLAEPALEASRNGTITFTPDRWTKVYDDWLENIRDWCISRQLWWGHRIPVWYCQSCGETIVAREDPTECSCGSADLEQDPDVLDTWFSSWLWPFSVFGWPEETPDLKAFYPTHALSTAPEILFFWVARMIMAGYEFMGEAPFTQVYLHGTVRDKQGRKMSKSLGNGIDPLEVVEAFGSDALRYTVISQMGVGTDIHLDHEDLEAAFAPGRNFANKVWNAGRFTLMNVGREPVRPLAAIEGDLEMADRWILSRLAVTSREMTQGLERFRLHEVAEQAHRFFWGEFADWYLELVKSRMRGEAGEASREAARTTLVTVFDGVCRLLHPIIPFVTEALWEKLPWPEGEERPEALIVAPWPEGDRRREDPETEEGMRDFQELVTRIRSLRKEYNIGEGQHVDVTLTGLPAPFRTVLESEVSSLKQLARVEAVRMDGERSATGGGAHDVMKNGSELFLPLGGVIDVERELARLRDEVERLSGQLASTEKKLENSNFVDRAPADVVDRERDKAESFRGQRDKLRQRLASLEAS